MLPIFISDKEKKDILEKLKIYGIKEIPYLLTKSNPEKIRIFSGNLTEKEIDKFTYNIHLQGLGLYFGKIDGDEIRVSIDALHLLKHQITENIIQLEDNQFEQYMKGNDVTANENQVKLTEKRIYYILKHKTDIIGMAKIVQGQIKNYLPKERRRKN